MTLVELSKSISHSAESLREKGRLVQHLAEVETATDSISDEVAELRTVTEAVRAIRTVSRVPSLPSAVFDQGASAFESLLEGTRSTLGAQPSKVAPVLNPVVDGRKSATKALLEAHSDWRERAVGDLDAVTAFAEAVKELWPKVYVEVMRLVQEARIGRSALPTTETMASLRAAIDRLKKIPEELAPSEATRRFLVAALGAGATFDDLTDEVRAWLNEQGLESRLRVRIAGSDD